MPCQHWRNTGCRNGGHCAIGAHPHPHVLHCLAVCEKYSGPARGRGDALKRRLSAIGVHQLVTAAANLVGADCGCAERQIEMNASNPAEWVRDTLEQP